MTPHDSRIVRQQDVEYIMLPEAEDVQEKSLGNYVHIIRKRKWLVVAPLFILLPLVVFSLVTKKPVYQATATVLIENVNPNIISIEEVVSPERAASSPSFYRTQYEIIKSPIILGIVVDKLRLDAKGPEEESRIVQMINRAQSFPGKIINIAIEYVENIFNNPSSENRGTAPDGISTDPGERRRLDAITRLQNSLQVEPREGTQLVDIVLSGSSLLEVVQQVNAIAEAYVRQNFEDKLNTSRKAVIWLRKEATDLKEKINKAESTLQAFKEKKNFIPLDQANGAQNPFLEKVNALQHTYAQIGLEKNDLWNRIQEVKKISQQDIEKMIGELPSILNSYSIESLKRRYSELNIQYNNLSLIYGKKHPKIVQVKSEIEKTKSSIYSEIDQIVNGIEKEYDVLSEKEKSIEKEWIKQRNSLITRSSDSMEYEELQRDLEIDKGLYLTVSRRLAETTLTEALESNNIKAVALASYPGILMDSGKAKVVLLSMMVALTLGGGLALLVENLDKRFHSVDEAERYLGMPFLGFVPNHNTKRNEPIALYNPGARASEAYRTLRTWIRFSFQNSGKILLITSPIPGEGKSHTAANLAISFAQLGKAVLLIDADLRRPTLHSTFNIVNSVGLTDILAYKAEWQSVLHETVLENLKVLPSGGRPHNPVELLSSRRMQGMLGRLKNAFDIVIIDAPITLAIPDVAIMAPEVDAVLLVHDPAKGDREAVLEAKKILNRAGANLLGMIFNNVSIKRQKHYYHANKYHHYTYESIPSPQKSKRGVPFVDMRPIESRQKWVIQSETTLDPSNHGPQTS